ncbi:carbon-nitrogen hydrolase family protein [Pantoea cypripedii]|uniref:carbon-nitrogen hydrolase family protein n=1 Tax=Pantoea cypripedii TaxID=55209 RepID=UPI001ABF0BA3|nr:carbon-nitrogen hydrolase family protein [Pantoea cypripedii]MBP2195104.1 putative amidohydrolase [Pantoea cypripedii]
MNSTFDEKLKIGCAQANPVCGDIQHNINKVVIMLKEAAEKGINILIFPEKFLSGYEPDLISANPELYAIKPGDPRLNIISAACREWNITAIVGAATTNNGALYISSIIFGSNGEELGRYHKQRLFHSEKSIYTVGEQNYILQMGPWLLGLGICYDSGFPDHAQKLAVQGCHAYLVSALFSRSVGYHESRTWFPARALDNTVYVLMANHCGITGGWDTCGGSAIWDPLGYLLTEADAVHEGIISVVLDIDTITEARKTENMLADNIALNDRRMEYQTVVIRSEGEQL